MIALYHSAIGCHAILNRAKMRAGGLFEFDAYRNVVFTGLIQHRGIVEKIETIETGSELAIAAPGWGHLPSHGDSISVNGCCLTVANDPAGASHQAGSNVDRADHDPTAELLRFHVIHQTLKLTTLSNLRPGQPVNLESAVMPQTLMGGHIVQGHVDGVGEVVGVDRDEGQWRVRIHPPTELQPCIIDQGSIAVDGVSLTVAQTDGVCFEIALIPTTLELTTLGSLRPGDHVNLEADYVARIVVNWIRRYASPDRFGVPSA